MVVYNGNRNPVYDQSGTRVLNFGGAATGGGMTSSGSQNGPYASPPLINWPTNQPAATAPESVDDRLRAVQSARTARMGPSTSAMPSYISSELGASRAAGSGASSSNPLSNFSLSYAPDPTAMTPGAYMPGHQFTERAQAGTKAFNDAYAMLIGMGYSKQKAEKVMAANGFANGTKVASVGGAGGGGAGGGYQSALDAANAANERRYQNLLSGYQDRYNRGMSTLEGMGDQERKDINTSYNRRAGDMNQSLASRGLGNTTVRDTMYAGNDRERTDAVGRLDERLRGQRLSTDAQLSGDVLGVIERRNDTGPDMNQMAQLQQAAAASGGGGGGGGGGYSVPGMGMYAGPTWFSGSSGKGWTPRDQNMLEANMAKKGRLTAQQQRDFDTFPGPTRTPLEVYDAGQVPVDPLQGGYVDPANMAWGTGTIRDPNSFASGNTYAGTSPGSFVMNPFGWADSSNPFPSRYE